MPAGDRLVAVPSGIIVALGTIAGITVAAGLRWARRESSVSLSGYSTITRSLGPRPKVSGWYISSAFGGGTTNVPGVVARAMYSYTC